MFVDPEHIHFDSTHHAGHFAVTACPGPFQHSESALFPPRSISMGCVLRRSALAAFSVPSSPYSLQMMKETPERRRRCLTLPDMAGLLFRDPVGYALPSLLILDPDC